MKTKIFFKKTIAVCIIVCIFLMTSVVSFAENDTDKYVQMFNIDTDNAYILLGNTNSGNDFEFIDGIQMGITDTSSPLYNEISEEKGIVGRKFYAGNYAAFNVRADRFANSDEFLFYITYYDFGPSQGSFHFEYINKEGIQKSVKIIKPGTVQRFNTECIYINDIDLSATLDVTGGNIRLATGGYNLFNRIEIVDISKFKKEGRNIEELAYIPVSAKLPVLREFQLIDEASQKYADMKKPCTYGDAYGLLSKLANGRTLKKSSHYSADSVVTQKDMVLLALDVLGLDAKDENPLDFAARKGVVGEQDFVYSDDLPASCYALTSVAYNVLYYKNENGDTRLKEMLIEGYWSDDFVRTNRTLVALSHTYPKYLPYKTITENATGQTYHYMNIMDIPTLRTYVTAQSWNSDATGFICGFSTGELFFYNTETQMLHYIDKCYNMDDRLNAIMGTDDYIYYPKIDDEGFCGIYKVNSKEVPSKPELVGRRKDKYTFTTPHITNDCKYLSVDLEVPGLGTCVSRYSVEDDEWIDYHKEFSYSDSLTHVLINPCYPNLICFSHELHDVTSQYMLDRMWQIDLGSGKEAENVYKQGVQENGMVMQGASHELWSNNGEYVYYINIEMGSGNNVGLSPSSVRYNKDGTHRQYFYDYTASDHQDKHLYPSGDDRFIVADGNVITLISQETHERFPISMVEWNGQRNHPYHSHPVVARNKYLVNWASMDYKKILGIKWFDFTALANKQAPGGRYEAGENLDRISYRGLDSESSEITYRGRKSILAKNGKSVYLDISDKVIDTVDGKVKISFDYFDNGYQPIKLSYTSGVKSDNDRWRVYDNFKTVKRTNTNRWKSCEIVIDSGNFENIGKHFSDIKITGSPANLYISDLKVSIPE